MRRRAVSDGAQSISSRTRSNTSLSKRVPRSLTSAAATSGASPRCRAAATDSDMRRSAHSSAASSPMAIAVRSSGVSPTTRSSSCSSGKVDMNRSGPERS